MSLHQAPDGLQKELRAFDPRLRLVFNDTYKVWQVEEHHMQSGVWSHVMYWCDLEDGDYRRKVFRDLPGTADPLVREIQKRDVQRAERCGSVLELARKLDAQGASERARKAMERSKERERRFAEFDAVMRRRAPWLVARHNMGGMSARLAEAERQAIRRDLAIFGG